jgi:hypothetical protein
MSERTWTAASGYRYGFSGMEIEDQIYAGKSCSSAQFWHFDSRVCRRWDVDKQSKVSESKYSALGANPISNVDPLGNDWYKSGDGTIQYDKNLTKAEQIKEKGAVYLGETYKEKSTEFRKDGSIFFKNEKDAYKRMWDNSKRNNVETAAIISTTGILVLPEYQNTISSSDIEGYGYVYSGSGKSLKISKGLDKFSVLGVIHTHPKKQSEDDLNSDLSTTDLSYLRRLKGIPLFALGWDNKVFGSFKRTDKEYYEDLDMSKVTRDDLITGKLSLLNFLKTYPTVTK